MRHFFYNLLLKFSNFFQILWITSFAQNFYRFGKNHQLLWKSLDFHALQFVKLSGDFYFTKVAKKKKKRLSKRPINFLIRGRLRVQQPLHIFLVRLVIWWFLVYFLFRWNKICRALDWLCILQYEGVLWRLHYSPPPPPTLGTTQCVFKSLLCIGFRKPYENVSGFGVTDGCRERDRYSFPCLLFIYSIRVSNFLIIFFFFPRGWVTYLPISNLGEFIKWLWRILIWT